MTERHFRRRGQLGGFRVSEAWRDFLIANLHVAVWDDEFLAEAWRAANDKARELGWIAKRAKSPAPWRSGHRPR
jgi:hypothetical protein